MWPGIQKNYGKTGADKLHKTSEELENNGGNLQEPDCQPAPRLRDKARCVRVTHRQLSARARLATAELHLLIITSLAPRMFTFFPQLLNKSLHEEQRLAMVTGCCLISRATPPAGRMPPKLRQSASCVTWHLCAFPKSPENELLMMENPPHPIPAPPSPQDRCQGPVGPLPLPHPAAVAGGGACVCADEQRSSCTSQALHTTKSSTRDRAFSQLLGPHFGAWHCPACTWDRSGPAGGCGTEEGGSVTIRTRERAHGELQDALPGASRCSVQHRLQTVPSQKAPEDCLLCGSVPPHLTQGGVQTTYMSAEVFQGRTPIQTRRRALSAPPRKNMPSAPWLVDLSALQEAKGLIPWQLGSPESKNPYGIWRGDAKSREATLCNLQPAWAIFQLTAILSGLRTESYPDKAQTYLELPAFIGFIKVIFRRSAAAPAGTPPAPSSAPAPRGAGTHFAPLAIPSCSEMKGLTWLPSAQLQKVSFASPKCPRLWSWPRFAQQSPIDFSTVAPNLHCQLTPSMQPPQILPYGQARTDPWKTRAVWLSFMSYSCDLAVLSPVASALSTPPVGSLLSIIYMLDAEQDGTKALPPGAQRSCFHETQQQAPSAPQPAPFLLLTCLHPAPAYKTPPYPAPAGQAAFQEQSRQVLVSSQAPVPALTSQAARTSQPATPPSEKRLMETVNIDGYHQMSLLYKVIQVAFLGEHAGDSKRPEAPLACPRGLSLPLAVLAVSVLQGSGHTDTQLHEGMGWGARGVGMDVDKAVCFLITHPAQACTEPSQLQSWEITVIASPSPSGDLGAVLQRHRQIPVFRRNLPSTVPPSCLPLPLTHCWLSCQLSAGAIPTSQERKKITVGTEWSPNLERNRPLGLMLRMKDLLTLRGGESTLDCKKAHYQFTTGIGLPGTTSKIWDTMQRLPGTSALSRSRQEPENFPFFQATLTELWGKPTWMPTNQCSHQGSPLFSKRPGDANTSQKTTRPRGTAAGLQASAAELEQLLVLAPRPEPLQKVVLDTWGLQELPHTSMV
ncbi:hypothetical protein Anapl_02388 [Anas platyrhynchos]|uniref:Uncharacterized protein n=1 Tax=Anas platyrhynchos TaxID=8839 RepID=R0L9N8_ANAPL|nr:hypothetical protein Anapl_02388 [Anas platyrhynchos]